MFLFSSISYPDEGVCCGENISFPFDYVAIII